MTISQNPLLDFTTLPKFSAIKPEHIKPAIEQLINDCKAEVENVLKNNTSYTWENFVEPLEEVNDKLGKAWSPVGHLNSVANNDELREAYESCLPLLSEYSTAMGQNKDLYQAYKSIKESAEFANLSQAQKKTIENELRGFKLSGIALPAEKQKRFAEIKARLSELSSQFSNNVLDATMSWTKHITDKADLAGVPESTLAVAQEKAKAKNLDGYLLTLDGPCFLAVRTYADNAELRKEIHDAFVTRASEIGPDEGKFDNTEVIDETLKLRHEIAQLLDFENYAERSLATKMAESSKQVMDFLDDLGVKSKPQGEKELAELKEYVKNEYNVEDLKSWDIPYYSEKLKQHLYNISDEELRPYFPEDKVVAGLFEVLNRLYDITITQKDGVDVWHKDVKFYEIFDKNNQLRGSFYLDLYAREHKRGGAWMDECVGRRIDAKGNLQHPVAYLTCNFTKPVGDKPALFTHDEVITLFHETGHGLHHMLTQVDVAAVSGISGVAWDAVELPSQFLENWCWETEALEFISGHYETGESLPKEMLDKMLKAKDFQAGMFVLRQLNFGIFDFALHANYNPTTGANIKAVLEEVNNKVALTKPLPNNRFYTSFGHIFAGGYAAGYYSYLWAEVLSADAFAKFEEEGIFNKQTGQAFLTNILEMGGSKEPIELFKAFRGREPQIDALLRHKGIKA